MPSASHPTLSSALGAIEAQFALPLDSLVHILARFRDRMVHGLAHDGADMAMIPSFGEWAWNGTEEGRIRDASAD